MKTSRIINNRDRLFWALHSAGWAGYGMATYAGFLIHDKPGYFLAVIAAVALCGFLLTLPLRYLFRRIWGGSPLLMASSVLLGSYAIAIVWRVIINTLLMQWVDTEWQPDSLLGYLSGVMLSFYIVLCWSGLYFGIKFYLQSQDQTERVLAATTAAHQAQLKMLRYQLNPHFLFNTLNAISTLILDRQNQTANLAVSRLSDFLRYTLDNDPMKRVTLGSELAAIDLYLEIEKVRFGDRLMVHKEVETGALDALVPSLILQPMIENAIKYAISPSEDGGTLKISAKVHGNMLMLQLADNGPGLGNGGKSRKSCGVGLKNTRERLQQIYGDDQAFTLAPNDPSGLVVTINIPFETEDHDQDTDS